MKKSRIPWIWIIAAAVLLGLLALSAAMQNQPVNADPDGCGG